jgi:predicted kinase
MLIVVSGLPGTGKSTLADGIARVLRAPVLSVDPIESAVIRAGIEKSFETGLAAYLVAETCADDFLAAGLDVIVDAVNAVEPARDTWRSLAARHGLPLRVIACALDPAQAARRLAARSRGLAMGEPTDDDLRARSAEWTPWPEAHLVIDAESPAGANVERALAWLREGR